MIIGCSKQYNSCDIAIGVRYRSAHHQPSKEVLDICDRMGILVLDETRRMSSAPVDLEELRTVIKHDRNHPSVILWGIGNVRIGYMS